MQTGHLLFRSRSVITSRTSTVIGADAAIAISVISAIVLGTMAAGIGHEFGGSGITAIMIGGLIRHFGATAIAALIASSARAPRPVITCGTMDAGESYCQYRHLPLCLGLFIFLRLWAFSQVIVIFRLCNVSNILPLCVFKKSLVSYLFRHSHFAIERFQEVICQLFFIIIILPWSVFNAISPFSSFFRRGAMSIKEESSN